MNWSCFVSLTIIAALPLCSGAIWIGQSRINYALVSRQVIQNIFSRNGRDIQCWEEEICQRVVDSLNASQCQPRRKSSVFQTAGQSKSTKQFHKVTCDRHRSKISGWEDTCPTGHHPLPACADTMCHGPGVWIFYRDICTKTLFQIQPEELRGHPFCFSQKVPVVLQTGHVVSLHLTGLPNRRSKIDLIAKKSEIPYRLSVSWRRREADFLVTRKGKPEDFSQLRNMPQVNISSFTMEIHITDNKYKTYLGGNYFFTVYFSIPFLSPRVMNLVGFKDVKVMVGENHCNA